LALALALVGRPEVVVLDEPTAGMDPEARATTRAIVAGLRDKGAAILLTSHDLTDVERLADRICFLDGGRIVAAGTPTELAAGVAPRLRFRLDRPLEAGGPGGTAGLSGLGGAVAAARPGALVAIDGDGARYRIDGVAPDAALVAAVAAWAADAGALIVELRTGEGTLEEAYLALVGSGAESGAVEAEP
jgi:ABC-2 type transport system ATP-binding protein